jgi:hypothetical protein
MGCFVVDGAPKTGEPCLSRRRWDVDKLWLGQGRSGFIDDVGLHVKLCGHREKDRAHAVAHAGHCERAAMFGMTPQTA